MSIHIALHHRTIYHYDRLVGLGPQIIRLRPAPHCRTPILGYSLKIEPNKHFLNWQQDPQGNFQARAVFSEKTREFAVTVDLVADMAVIDPFDFFLEPQAETWPFDYDPALAEELAPFRKAETPGRHLRAWLASIDRRAHRSVDFLVALNRRIAREITYVIRMDPGVQTIEETFSLGRGACRDTAWMLVQILRHLGFAARFVSGYLIQLMPDQPPLQGPPGPTHDFTDLHAWAEVYLPGAGWVGFDPTSGLLAGEGHIPLAASYEPQSAAAISGAVDEAEVEFGFEMKLTRVKDAPRVTKPYSEDSWARIQALGRKIDDDLEAGAVRLTMGGEPTFVSIDDVEGAEWNTASMGPNKRRYAGRLLTRLRDRFAPGGLLQYGQGKWYPGESLPRWALNCFWRLDGESLWRDPKLQASDDDRRNDQLIHAEAFAESLADRLGVSMDFSRTAYEDAFYWLWRERRLPVNVDPLKSNLNDPEERARIERVFRQGLNDPVGIVLPLARAGTHWTTGPWFLRDDTLYLLPGDSPIGYRLPLDALPWVSEAEFPYHWQDDPFALRRPFGVRETRIQLPNVSSRAPVQAPHGSFGAAARVPRKGHSAPDLMRTALCVEPRDGLLHIFVPPLHTANDYIDLIAAIEDTAEVLAQPVIIEGYEPPFDPRLGQFSITPDPGVIEVNIHPSKSFDELVERTVTLYDEARSVRLGTEKFMIDGRHVGTGGGNHIVMGGATPAESPFLRRPDLLKSLIGYWQNHPALSFLFSGLFIGPTSQHPRVDEAREDALHELEIAFREIRQGESLQPWLIDRILRNVLIDATGNAHRTEFCIDKLFAPDSAAGRRGLVELRAFEMPPHARMSIAQQLLLRGLVAMFWERPYDRPLVRWGNRLHDEFMLPHFVRQDFDDVLGDLSRHGYGFEPVWFEPHHEFRFPVIGAIAARGLEIELRHALEPWHVMGEEAMAGGAVRYVDSSVERIQVKIDGLVDTRHVVACNGHALPLHGTGTEGQYVAGVRFKAWAPPSALHPTVPVHTPLTIDVFDRWTGRSLGGCAYHVMHPGGRNYEHFPVNANEAEARRRARFFPFGHTPAEMKPGDAERNPDYPLTLDLRRRTHGIA